MKHPRATPNGGAETPKRKVGRPTIYDDALITEICTLLGDGKSLSSICRMPGMPKIGSVLRRINEDPVFSERYAKARVAGVDAEFERLCDIQDEEPRVCERLGSVDAGWVAWRRLQTDTLKWALSKRAPARFAEKYGIGGAEGLPPIQTKTTEPDNSVARVIAYALDKGLKAANDPVPRQAVS
jgi:hypothetical protein